MTAWPWACSGERYCAVPMIEPVSVISEAPARAMPKSVTLAWPCVVDDDVVRLEVAVDHAAAVGEAGGGEHLDPEVDRVLLAERRLLGDHVLERAPGQALHRDVVGALVLAAVEDADHVGMRQRGGRLGLAAEALHELDVLGEAPVQDLERDLAAEVGVLGAVDVGHPARADPARRCGSGRRRPCRRRPRSSACLATQQLLEHALGQRRRGLAAGRALTAAARASRRWPSSGGRRARRR